jgi:hypothetical protein
MSLVKGLFPDRGFHYKKGTKQTNKLGCPPFSLPPSRLSGVYYIIAAASLTHPPQQTKLSPNFKKIVLLGTSNFQTKLSPKFEENCVYSG